MKNRKKVKEKAIKKGSGGKMQDRVQAAQTTQECGSAAEPKESLAFLLCVSKCALPYFCFLLLLLSVLKIDY